LDFLSSTRYSVMDRRTFIGTFAGSLIASFTHPGENVTKWRELVGVQAAI
jgi:hypothetical protein